MPLVLVRCAPCVPRLFKFTFKNERLHRHRRCCRHRRCRRKPRRRRRNVVSLTVPRSLRSHIRFIRSRCAGVRYGHYPANGAECATPWMHTVPSIAGACCLLCVCVLSRCVSVSVCACAVCVCVGDCLSDARNVTCRSYPFIVVFRPLIGL